MFSVRQKQLISKKIQEILKETNHPELPDGEISFNLHVEGSEKWSWADIKNNGSVDLNKPPENMISFLHNEMQDREDH